MKRILVVLAVLAIAGVGAFAQTSSDAHNVVITIAPIAAIDLNNTTDVTFTTAAGAAGDDPGPTALAPATDTSKRLWYTAANLAAATRRITVGGSVATPAGTTLTVDAIGAEGGANQGPITIGVAAQDLVTGIGSIATGRGGADGAGLTYSFWVSTPASLVVGATPTTIVVTYTLTDDA